MSYATLWLGPYQTEGLASFQRAKDAGMSTLRAMALGQVGSFKDCWMFRRALATATSASVRTVQRALTQGRELGLIGTARGAKTETPPGAQRPVSCGFSHRWSIGWGQAGQVVKQAVAAARASFEARKLKRLALALTIVPVAKPTRVVSTHRRWTAAELDDELAKTKPPDT